MKLKSTHFESCLEFNDNIVSLIVEDVAKFSNIIERFYMHTRKLSEKREFVLLDYEENILDPGDVCCIFDVLNFDFNQRKLVNKLYLKIYEDYFFDVDNEERFDKKINDLQNIVLHAISEFDMDLEITNEIDFTSVLKMFNLRIEQQDFSIYNNLMRILELIVELELYALVIFPNIKNVLTKQQYEEIIKFIVYHKIGVLFIDRSTKTLEAYKSVVCENERIYYIDDDYEEYVIIN
ncbi:CRISPR type II-A-associated protein Csn2 [Breznakia sp. PF5-3]|uniref:type II-A CRISPR-associated protein Csn2 n=1 Tax=unclassified Breznakia TaxID=2623764 RepID=UPI00240752FC|nr:MULTISPECIES: type II-A CRISPR-associated protein Csn2 [unclassified Breznakia]MDF9824447.1 CRISPR type II-A-associated protein Csn2 [Breznakia sp. PM6-1]MDF9835270.1 CRISPR type II-A-associated protein Csn2 [Breznakia sp. PF5-3]MDF9837402.1 CRISPR type II-A-associated protein Csn2 [Breznakia sp. PFB2-8]MDF9859337.1 CRISPR type II-A-associated protein Csn2 [Breznakia sp. PH5-24]